MSENNTSLTADYWAKFEPTEQSGSYYTSPLLRPYLIESAYGADLAAKHANNPYWAEDILLDKLFSSVSPRSVLSLCCGFGAVEQYLLSKLDGVEKCVALDVSKGALEVAGERAEKAGLSIEYQCVDINNFEWPEAEFDLVVANGALHHIQNLEGVLNGAFRSLTPGGTLYACEYIGPNYMDHSIRQLELINACAFLVPPELRARKPMCIRNDRLFHTLSKLYSVAARPINPVWPKAKQKIAQLIKRVFRRDVGRLDFGKVYISPKSRLLRVDPSECIRSSEILTVARSIFGDVQVMPFGGGILQHAIDENFFHNFNSKNLRHQNALKRLQNMERELTASGEICDENAFIFCRKS